MYLMKTFLLMSSIAFIFQSCKTRQTGSLDTTAIKDTVVKDIPEIYKDKDVKSFISKEQELLGIDSIENGYQDLQIRIWVSSGLRSTDTTQLFIFKKHNSNITGELYFYTMSVTIDSEPFNINKNIIKIHPKSGWAVFMDSLQNSGIYTLPDDSKLKGYVFSADGYGIRVEIATKNTYRIYSYADYDNNIDAFVEARKILQLLKLLQKEFSIKVFTFNL